MTPLDLIPLPSEQIVNADAKRKAEFVKDLHQKVRKNIEERTRQYAQKANKGQKRIIFEPGDWVWVHMRKERFPAQRRSKLLPRGDGPFQVLERINDNSYKLDLPGEYNVSASFNVSDLSPYDVGDDLRTSRFEGGGDDTATAKDNKPLVLPTGPITRARAKRFKEGISAFINGIWCNIVAGQLEINEPSKPCNILQVQLAQI